jgi:acyl-CoA synthetase (AMP-forming)/AMP-acid ligase II/3-oxoacyl-(acyl-carrier-protein) synthase/acyl carrier protein
MYHPSHLGNISLTDILFNSSKLKWRGITLVFGSENKFISYRQLYQNSIIYLNFFKSKGIKPGDELLINSTLNYSGEFLYAFWGCIMGGIIAVPISGIKDGNSRIKVSTICKQLSNPHILISKNEINSTVTLNNTTLKTLLIEDINESKLSSGTEHVIQSQPDNIAFIQYSSGSTSQPKGVVLTHQNLITNIQDSISRSQLSDHDSTLSWMPLSHDMGLIGFHITPLVRGINQYIIPTETFIKSPAIWLQKVSEYKITVTASPNFGLNYSLKYGLNKLSENTDLSSVRLLFNGAEPISISLCKKFLNQTEKYGLNKNCLFPVYGLAEASLSVTYPLPSSDLKTIKIDRRFLKVGDNIKHANESDENGSDFINLGSVLENCELKIFDDNGIDLEESKVGNIFIRGKNVTSSYYKNNEQTKNIISNEGWLNTGDLGIIKDKCLYVVGRKKDVIFIDGQNFYAHDIEQACTAIENIELGKIAACGKYNFSTEKEELILFVVNSNSLLEEKIIRHISKIFHIKVDKIISVKKIPKTSSGKIQHYKLLEEFQHIIDNEVKAPCKNIQNTSNLNSPYIESWLIEKLAQELEIDANKININKPLANYGLDSKTAVRIMTEIEGKFNISLPSTFLWDYPSISDLTLFISGNSDKNIPVQSSYNKNKDTIDKNDQLIAIVGMGCRFPGNANSPELFWEVLQNGKDCITKLPNTRLQDSKLVPENYFGGFINDVDCFDGDFFGISKTEIDSMDPQQRILLEVCWEALENAGINPESIKGSSTGMYLGISSFDFAQIMLDDKKYADAYLLTGSSHGTAAGRISYLLGLNGPSLAIDTACSSSLVSLHYACQDLLLKETDISIAAGVNLLLSHQSYIALSKLQALSSDGKCKTFDQDANGYVRGEGCGVLILKRLADAIEQRDHIMAVIKSTAVNQDGQSQGLIAPNGKAQEALIKKALSKANVKEEDISFIETHGTGTVIGDAIETNAIQNVFLNDTNRKYPLALGSVKTNIGHLEAAAGIASVIKTVLALKNEAIPPHLNLKKLNSSIQWDKLAIQIPTNLLPWKSTSTKRIAGLSSFGFSGTNAHAIIEEYNRVNKFKDEVEDQILCFSAKTEAALLKLTERYIQYFNNNPTIPLQHICYTANSGRAHFHYRASFTANSNREMLEQLNIYYQNKGNSLPLINNINKEIIQDYLNFKEINWGNLYKNKICYKVELPTYPFHKKKYPIYKTIDEQSFQASKIDKTLTDALIINQQLRNSGSILAKLEVTSEGQKKRLITNYICDQAKAILGYEDNFYIDIKKPFFELGFDSLMAVYFKNKLAESFKVKLYASMVYEYPNIDKLSEYIYTELNAVRKTEPAATNYTEETEKENEFILKSSDEEVEKLLIEKLNKYNSPDE